MRFIVDYRTGMIYAARPRSLVYKPSQVTVTNIIERSQEWSQHFLISSEATESVD